MNRDAKTGKGYEEKEIEKIQFQVSRTRTWLLVSGVIAVVLFGLAEIAAVPGFFLGIVSLFNSTYSSPTTDVFIFIPIGLFGIILLGLLVWLGISAILTAVEGKKFTGDGSSAGLIAYLSKMRITFTLIGTIAIIGIIMFLILMIAMLIALLGTSFIPSI